MWVIGGIVVTVIIVARWPRAALVLIPAFAVLGMLQFVSWLFKPLPQAKRSQRRRQPTQKSHER